MASLVPNRFLFKFELSLHRCRKAPAIKGRVADWNDRWRLPALHVIDGEDGFGVGVGVAFGLPAARRAASLNPIEALRHD